MSSRASERIRAASRAIARTGTGAIAATTRRLLAGLEVIATRRQRAHERLAGGGERIDRAFAAARSVPPEQRN